ncbi:cation diffusion facilitator family transporter [Dorea sp. AM58-8]|uniref:cation diffusion facilitator family transporter n=1 Tax=Dorea sp. AM58-8 TaxID=2292346 RepID=UPI000E4BCF11|nr:cation diffusion facilitator family transporter [Dorea sp. AM58-8]RGY81070.1 cation diffusion facilitator family transporter [Dorea sp. AM58-8]
MHVGKKMQKREKSAMSVSLYGNLVFVVIELMMALVTDSQAVLLDAVYDGVEFCMLLPSIFLIPLLYKPSNEEHPFGYMQIETIFVVVKGITMTAVTFGLIFNNINLMLHGGHIVSFHTVAGFELFACILGIIVTVYLYYKNKQMESPLINMEMQGWRIDSFISLGMTIAFLLPMLIPFDWFQHIVPYLDQLITIVLSLVMIPTPIHTVITGIRDLMLIPPEEETIDDIKETIEPIIGVYGHKNLYYDIVRTGRKLWISVYISFEKDIVSLSKFKQLQDQCIKALASKYSDFYFELLPDIEFTGIEDIE